MSTEFASARRWVVKVGSSLVTRDGLGLDHAAIASWAAQIATLREHGHEITVVSSGAVAEGMSRLGLSERPAALAGLQAAAAVGQLGVVQAYQQALDGHGLLTAQILLTHEDCAARDRYLNARNTLNALLARGIVPIVNENDTVATDEIRFGDNDNLAGLTVDLVGAGLLVILTDRDGVMNADPAISRSAELIPEIGVDDPELDRVAGGGGRLGRGGMKTKIEAARRAARCGAATVIANGRREGVLTDLLAGEVRGSLLRPDARPLPARKRWIAGRLRLHGRLHIDAGAARVLRGGGKSLLPVGVVRVEGQFRRGDLVACIDPEGVEVARGLVNYDAGQARQLVGQSSTDIAGILGQPGEQEMMHRDNLVLS